MSKVTYAKLHGTAFVPGVGNLTDTLENDVNKPTRNIKMHKVAGGISCEIPSKQGTTLGLPVTFFIPDGNIQLCVLAPEPKIETPKSK